MGYVVAHVDKSKSGQSGGLTLHIDRKQKQVSKNIDSARTHKNFELVDPAGSIDEMIKDRIKEGYKGKKAIRKDAVTSCRYILSGSHEEMSKWPEHKIKKWALDNYEYFAQLYGEKNIIRATVHMDEKTPHMHLIAVPLTDNGRLSAKEFIGNKTKLKEFQTDYAAKIGKKYGLDRGIEDSNRKHITTRDYYRYMTKNEMTAEKLLQHKNSKELVGKLLDIADPKQKELKKVSHKKIRENEPRRHQKRTTGGREETGTDKRNSKGLSF